MRKFLAIALAAVCVFALCSCTPDESDIKEAFKENGYVVNSMDSIYAVSFGVDVDDVEYVLLAIGQDNSSTVYVVGFKDKKAAKEAMMNHCKGKPLLPKVFKDQNHIDEIKGMTPKQLEMLQENIKTIKKFN